MTTKKQLIESIEAYAAAKASANLTLIQMAAHALKTVLDAMPDEIGTQPEPSQSTIESPNT